MGSASFLPFRTAVTLLNALRRDYHETFRWKEPPYEYEFHKLPIEILIGGRLDSVFADETVPSKGG